ncbi:2,4-dienoyl-CoA reductase-like NADH-dependent reductase (Old Yellow Enzyme family) [Halanaerobium sp. DL-01]|uniref:oxidoreductase n=1 Tax=Halanaerobium sp. DL-01 TaxID=1653064 RepID=UPI000DF291BF|nr:FAD-dependent oxidoreductase [Halanaerobium sp. DL-01]RCW78783.1 2,4-dienoyl-CoA reductase-like NADH-dependent reductase (Old Yellow Enzyme family) [Halanaerobium sp. DL-01]
MRDKVFESLKVGNLSIKNRIAMSPMVTNYCGEDGELTDRYIEYIRERARGGPGLIILEAAYVHPTGKGFRNELGIHKDELISDLKKLTEIVHEEGSKIGIQLYHGGRQTSSDVTGQQVVAPSPIPCPVKQEKPKELTKKEIDEIIDAFAKAAERAKKAGFDLVEIHGAHGYLLNQFLSPYSNKRNDEYGGSFKNRKKFPLEVVKNIRKKVGDNYTVTYRLTSEEFVEGGLTINETKNYAQDLVNEGIDLIHVSGGVYETSHKIIQPFFESEGLYVDNALEIKEAINGEIPVMVVGRLKNPEKLENTIAKGIDMVAVGRGFLADPYFPKKMEEGREEDIRKCIGCNQGCIDRLFAGDSITCLGNPLCGQEYKYNTNKTTTPREVMVIGGGPAGMEAARTAAERGHKVKLYEKENKLGGKFSSVIVPPYKDEFDDLNQYLKKQLEKVGVDIKLGTEVDKDLIENNNVDEIIMATGSTPIKPELPGADRKNVVFAEDVLTGRAEVEGNILVVGAGLVGCETAEYLAEKGFDVQVIEALDQIGADVGSIKPLLLANLNKLNVDISKNTSLKEIKENKVIIEKKGKEQIIEDISTVVLAVGYSENKELLEQLKETNINVQLAGDSVYPRKIIDAIHEGFRAAYNIE